SLIFPDDVERVTELADRSATGLAIASWRARYVRADGSVFWGQFTIAPTFDSGGDFIGTGGSIVDVTGEVDAVTELADSERKFRMLASNTGDLVLWIRDGVILWASPASSQFGWRPDDLINQPSVS
ncbi:MAG TPA: hypothetical protein DCQ04_02890, partial [Actinobacteria bacterium]|nr:hypothetical protein [Actinomycetota bacterium]